MLPEVRMAIAPGPALTALAFVCGGVALGACSGLVPGLHANNMALLLAAGAPAVPGPPQFVAAAMLAAGVVHTFLDVVSALALGVPDPAMAASALPVHRLVVQWRGREALRLSTLGSGLAVELAVELALPVPQLMTTAYPPVRAHIPIVLAGVALALVVTEPTLARAVAGGASFLLAAGLGVALLDLDPAAALPAGGMLVPLFAGLFGAPVLVEAIGSAGVPSQDDATVAVSRQLVAGLSLVGTLAGAVVGYPPGV